MEEHHRPNKKITTELPHEILFYNILPRLPAESLHRFRYVSKQWHMFLSSPEFIKLHLHHVTNDHHQNHHKLLVLSTTAPCNLHTIDCESPESGLSRSRPIPFKVCPENMTIMTSCNGLVCVGITKRKYDDKYHNLILWNPLTDDYKKLSKSHSCKECYEVCGGPYGLYYSYSHDDYRLLRVTHDRHAYIYSLKSDSWRKLDSSTSDLKSITCLISESWGESIVQNEKVYFIKQGKRRTLGHLSNSIIRKFSRVECQVLEDGWRWRLDRADKLSDIAEFILHSEATTLDEEWELGDILFALWMSSLQTGSGKTFL
ncbi:putative F-box only protein 15 [Lactuca sativa]|uniref:putative F-box only protein 15 n=1 Tax=Lactuca sativa TaxID=4236 RepID=UPI000CBDF016|nr:putative F-box only protein 15 [Lactuca sativa]